MPNLKKTTGEEIPFIGEDLDKDGLVDTTPARIVDGDFKEVFTGNNPGTVKLSGSQLIAAGQATAISSDQAIVTTGFTHINIFNDGSVDLVLAIDESSKDVSAKIIIIKSKQPFSDDILGSELHFTASESCVFNYQLR